MKPTMTAHEKNVSIDYWLLLDRFHALREQHLILSEQYEGWKQSLLPSQVRFQLLERNQQVCQQFKFSQERRNSIAPNAHYFAACSCLRVRYPCKAAFPRSRTLRSNW
jgi:hypothetical protein